MEVGWTGETAVKNTVAYAHLGGLGGGSTRTHDCST